ncbi:choice-of-anchor J domain-containing protein [Chitinophaga oryzae]|uniref:Choice-of-anchor J domain-containing protein n=1 Tax=Chitinophaga oryzae TaxID=2725414 RepID=A0AAE7D7K3_9BACT|nr:M43 family zinc metalloprotease [Chitinophaga oryzae]QJB32341.1 choice-of-anchor J domain-containing protein [Chitinophaga oryzae]QJB38814.1 choice-of-anchor J domain-containing protein [Chitinophaga oryzae]
MRHYFIILFTLLYSVAATGQRKCGTAVALQQRVLQHPSLQQVIDNNEKKMQLWQQRRMMRVQTEAVPQNVTIPVVVHIVLDNPDLVTDAQVLSQIAVLNQDYNAANPDISQVPSVWQPVTGNARISFCLAQRTPGDEPTTGIVRVKTTAGRSFDISGGAPDAKYAQYGGSDAWDTRKYLNIWVTRLSGNYLGVAAPPGVGYPVEQEGVVVLYTAFGTTGSVGRIYNLGRTTTHEIGHYFGLRHIWADDSGGCAADDGISDTPPQGDNTYGCPAFPRTDNCSPNFPGIMFMNYMDYTDDACMHLFTAGQTGRIRDVLENTVSSLMSSNGCTPVVLPANDAALTAVTGADGKRCDNRILPQVTLRNKGTLPLTSVRILYRLNNGALVNYNWQGNLSSLQSTNVPLPASQVTTGVYNLQAYTQSPNGQPDANVANDTTTSRFHFDAEVQLPFEEGFEQDSFPPPGWDLYNPDRSFTWERDRNVGHNSQASALVRNKGYNVNDQTDDLLTPVIDPQGHDSIFLFFDVAAAVYSNPDMTGNVWDTLQVLVTKDCRQTAAIAYAKWGKNLITRPTPVLDEFIPSNNEWRRDSVDLTALAGKDKFQVAFRNISNAENNIYIDNIRIVTKDINPELRQAGVLVHPNPTDGLVWISFYERPADLQQVNLYNAAGQLVRSQPGNAIGANNRMTFNLVNEPNGVYFVKLIYRNRANTIKLMKVR